MSTPSEDMSNYGDSNTSDIIRSGSPIGVVKDLDRDGTSKKKARFDDEYLRDEEELDPEDKGSSYDDDYESEGDESQDQSIDVTRRSGPDTVNQDDFREDYQNVQGYNQYNSEENNHETHSPGSSICDPDELSTREQTNQEEQTDQTNININSQSSEKADHYSSKEDINSQSSEKANHYSTKEDVISQDIQNSTSTTDSHVKETQVPINSPSTTKNYRDNESVDWHGSRENTNVSLLSRRSGGRRHSAGNSRSPPRRGINQKDPRHYTTMKAKDLDGRIKYDNISLKSASSRTSGLLSSLLDLMSSKFIYETDPFEGALRRCPKVAFNVVEKATTPISMDIIFGNPQKQTLPSYYYTSTDRNSAMSRRGGSRMSRSSSAQSVSVGDKSVTALDSPRSSPKDLFRHEIDAFIPEEDEDNRHMRRSGKTKKEGSLPNILVSDHSLPHTKPGQRRSAKRPVTSSSTKTNKSLGLPGKPLKS